MWKNLHEEVFYLVNYLHMSYWEARSLPVGERKWLLERFVEQKKKENEQAESERRKAQTSRSKRR